MKDYKPEDNVWWLCQMLTSSIRAIGDAAPLLKEVREKVGDNSLKIPSTLYDLMQLRDRLYALDGVELPADRQLLQSDETGYSELVEVANKASNFENKGKYLQAIEEFEKLLKVVPEDYSLESFKTYAEAGLYRCSKKV